MTRVVIVGEIYNADVQVGGGPVYRPGGPTDPGWGVTPPTDPGYGRPEWERPPYVWGQRPPHVGGGPVYPGHPTGGPLPPGEMPQGGTEVPEDVFPPPPVPEEIASQYIVSVYNPKTMTWTTKSYPPR
jgi:hypothetical protein